MFASNTYRNEQGYMSLLRDCLESGVTVPDRTGHGRKKILGPELIFDTDISFPAFTARSTPLRIAFEEFMAFLNGDVFIKDRLNKKNIKIWDAHTSRRFLDSRGLSFLPEGHMGKSYGFQFRHFSGEYGSNYMPQGGIDQVRVVYDSLKKDPFSSRHLISIWNPSQLDEMPLPPCWHTCQFVVLPLSDGGLQLNLKVTSRSSDITFGLPFNVQQYAFFLTAMAAALDMSVGKMKCSLFDAHIYGNQLSYVEELIDRDIINSNSSIRFGRDISNLEDILSLEWSDIITDGFLYNKAPFKTPKPELAM